jgi:archaetidylinositol phosphate synthase
MTIAEHPGARNGAQASTAPPLPRTWDGRLARVLVTPLAGTSISPNHLTTLRLVIGLAGAIGLAVGTYREANIGAFLIAVSNFVDHTDGELARITGKTSRFGHLYDLACDAIVTVLLFTCLGVGIASAPAGVPSAALGAIAGVAVAAIFYFRMRIESLAGKRGVQQSYVGGFETEDVLYLFPLVTLFDVGSPFLVAASVGATLFAVGVLIEYARVTRRPSWGA